MMTIFKIFIIACYGPLCSFSQYNIHTTTMDKCLEVAAIQSGIEVGKLDDKYVKQENYLFMCENNSQRVGFSTVEGLEKILDGDVIFIK